ncbi:hypothetical protein K9U40_15590 [Xanthobacter autotrophicus]|uniref:hypothetical protein n=1 Tax=Xanthobacter TaxID=279 RepID=UPI0024ABD19F|nr:hypothetical protein [Xanthobacter autotrophicus]MDI4665733.1 hypothetical protein [Xanthobacter autotrophicus]
MFQTREKSGFRHAEIAFPWAFLLAAVLLMLPEHKVDGAIQPLMLLTLFCVPGTRLLAVRAGLDVPEF